MMNMHMHEQRLRFVLTIFGTIEMCMYAYVYVCMYVTNQNICIVNELHDATTKH